MLKVLIVDNDYTYVESLFNEIALESAQEFRVVGLFNDGEKALNYILNNNNNVDILITELELPKISGTEIIEKINTMNLNISIVALSKNPNQIINIVNKNLSVDKIFIKPFATKELFNFLNSINKKETDKIVIDLLKDFNYNKNTLGYIFIVEALSLCIEKNYSYIKKMKDLYEELENQYNRKIPAEKIYWNISKAIIAMNESTDIAILNKYFPYNNNPSPKSFFNEMLMRYRTM